MKLFRGRSNRNMSHKQLLNEEPTSSQAAELQQDSLPPYPGHNPVPGASSSSRPRHSQQKLRASRQRQDQQRSARGSAPPVPSSSPPPAAANQPPPQQQPQPHSGYQQQIVTTETTPPDPEVTRELIRKFVADIWNRGEVELIDEVCSPSLRFNGSVGMDRVGHDGFAKMVSTIRDSLSDYHCEIHSMVVEGNKAFCRMRFTGRHTGSLLGYPPTGRQVSWMGATEFTIKKRLIAKVWELGDVKSLEEQLKGPSTSSVVAAAKARAPAKAEEEEEFEEQNA